MRSDRLYLADILEAIDRIERWLADCEEVAFLSDELRQSAVLQQLSVIGEAAARLGPETREATAVVPWKEIIGFRNIAVHAYFSVDWHVVYVTAFDDLPPLKKEIRRLLA